MPVQTPELDPIVATVVELLLHVPPVVPQVSVVVVPGQIELQPLIDVGAGFTVTLWVTKPVPTTL